MTDLAIQQACRYLKQGGIIAYPTEAVYGFGCDPFQEEAVIRLLSIKQRHVSKGLILIAANWQHFAPLVENIDSERLGQIKNSWPGPTTWLFPASAKAPKWITGEHQTIALRLTNHPIAARLCQLYNGPIVSTSANLANHSALTSATQVREHFGDQIDYILEGETGSLTKPTPIRDAQTGQFYRQ